MVVILNETWVGSHLQGDAFCQEFPRWMRPLVKELCLIDKYYKVYLFYISIWYYLLNNAFNKLDNLSSAIEDPSAVIDRRSCKIFWKCWYDSRGLLHEQAGMGRWLKPHSGRLSLWYQDVITVWAQYVTRLMNITRYHTMFACSCIWPGIAPFATRSA